MVLCQHSPLENTPSPNQDITFSANNLSPPPTVGAHGPGEVTDMHCAHRATWTSLNPISMLETVFNLFGEGSHLYLYYTNMDHMSLRLERTLAITQGSGIKMVPQSLPVDICYSQSLSAFFTELPLEIRDHIYRETLGYRHIQVGILLKGGIGNRTRDISLMQYSPHKHWHKTSRPYSLFRKS